MKRNFCAIVLVIFMFFSVVLSGCDFFAEKDKTPLDTPSNLSLSGTLLTWNEVENASGYSVRVGNVSSDCNNNQFELAQLSLADGEYYVMVKAKGGQNFVDSDYSMAIKYTVGKTDSVVDEEVDSSLARSRERYSPVRAPLTNNAPPLISSSTDYTNNYYLVDGGYIENTPISSGLTIGYNGVTPISVTFGKSSVTTESVETSIENTVTESVSETSMGSASLNISYETGELAKLLAGKITVGAEYSRQWGTVKENSNSTTSTYTLAKQVSEEISETISYTIGNNGEKAGDYRLSMVTTCDVYYLVTTSRDNTQLKEFKMILCARPGVKFVLEYSEDGYFGKTSESQVLDWPENFYQNYPMPTDTIPCKITLDTCGGYALDQNTFSVVWGQTYEFPVSTKYNYSFVGWYGEPDGQGKKYTNQNGALLEPWADYGEKTLYACWTKTSGSITSVSRLELASQQTYSSYSSAFSLGLDLAKLKEAGYNSLNISITGACSGYDYKMNEYGRYFVLLDANTTSELMNWRFEVKGFSGVENKTISLDRLNVNGQYLLQLVSDKSDAYNEKLVVSGIVITVTAIK